MKLFTADIVARLMENGRKQEPVRGTDEEIDFHPVVKLFTPDAGCTWLLTEIDPEDADIAFGLCDLGLGFPELGSVSIAEITALRGRLFQRPFARRSRITVAFPRARPRCAAASRRWTFWVGHWHRHHAGTN